MGDSTLLDLEDTGKELLLVFREWEAEEAGGCCLMWFPSTCGQTRRVLGTQTITSTFVLSGKCGKRI